MPFGMMYILLDSSQGLSLNPSRQFRLTSIISEDSTSSPERGKNLFGMLLVLRRLEIEY